MKGSALFCISLLTFSGCWAMQEYPALEGPRGYEPQADTIALGLRPHEQNDSMAEHCGAQILGGIECLASVVVTSYVLVRYGVPYGIRSLLGKNKEE